jgi:hypothetical protein
VRDFYFFYGFTDDKPKGPLHGDLTYIKIDRTVIDEMKKRNHDANIWMRAFLRGPTSKHGSNGIRKIRAASRTNLFEIKVLSFGQRILAIYDKSTHTWRWIALINHDQVDDYCKDHNL